MATLALLTQGHNQLFPPTTAGRIPDGVIENRKATKDEKDRNRKLAKDYASAGFGWKGREWECLLSLWTGESRFDHYADNPESTAFGIAQRLGEESKDPRVQILKGLRYVSHRYQTPCKAWAFWLKRYHY